MNKNNFKIGQIYTVFNKKYGYRYKIKITEIYHNQVNADFKVKRPNNRYDGPMPFTGGFLFNECEFKKARQSSWEPVKKKLPYSPFIFMKFA